MKGGSKVRLIIPARSQPNPDDTIILDERSMGQDRHLRGKKVSLIEVTAEITCQDDIRDLIRKLEWAYTFLIPSDREDFSMMEDSPRRKPRNDFY